MKKFLFLAMAFGLAACSIDDANDLKGVTDGEGIQQYLSVNLVPAPVNTRAEGDTHTGEPGDATYEEGYEEENTVNAVRFYFFDANGNVAAVKTDGKNYFDWKDAKEDGDNMPNVEKLLQAVVVIETPQGDELPAKIAAVINPETEALGDGNLSLADLRARTKDYVAAITAEQNPGFVMMNAVYANVAEEVTATDVTSKNYAPSPEAAMANPVNIYVERNVAKVRVKFDEDKVTFDDNNRIALKDQAGDPIKVNDKQVYLELGNWNLTAYTDKGYLSKHIDAQAWNTAAPFANWNYAPYFRSYWAENPATVQNWISYNEIETGGQGYGSENNSNILYTNENAPQTKVVAAEASTYADFTKVIIAGKLVDEDGKEVEITKYAGIMSAGEGNLIAAMLNNLTTGNSMIYSYTETDGGLSFNALDEDDVEFVTALAANQAVAEEDNEGGRYYVYLQLKADLNKKWSKTDDEDTYKDNLFVDDAAVNKYLIANLGKAQVYSGGLTYYYFPIRHLAGAETSIGYYGVVRNHIYDCNITELVGLGTPVYDPTETIYPEHPSEDDTYIAARINILSWRLVSQDTELKW